MPAIRHIASGVAGDGLLLTAEFEHRVSIWSSVERTLLGELDTVLDYGGRRLALAGSGAPVVVAGAWERHGICAYGPDGTLLWQRKDLKKPQLIAPALGGTVVTACFDDRPMHVLAATTGETLATVRGVRGFYDSPFGSVGLGEFYEQVALIGTNDWKVLWKAPIDGLSALRAAHSPEAIAVSVGGEFLRSTSHVVCFGPAGEERWRWPCPPQSNCLGLAWDIGSGAWLGVISTEPVTLVRWSDDGRVLSEYPLGTSAECAFLHGGQALVTGDGAVRETGTGALVWELGRR